MGAGIMKVSTQGSASGRPFHQPSFLATKNNNIIPHLLFVGCRGSHSLHAVTRTSALPILSLVLRLRHLPIEILGSH
jgi:hypothetical protein